MDKEQYEQKRAECWIEFCKEHPIETPSMSIGEAFAYAFDYAYALGREKEPISQEEIEKAAQEHADELRVSPTIPGALMPMLHDIAKSSYLQGAQDFIGAQEKDADTVISGWVARDQDGYVRLFKDKPIRDTCDKDDIPYGFWDDVDDNCIDLPITSFPDLTWNSDPIEVEIIIKPKKK